MKLMFILRELYMKLQYQKFVRQKGVTLPKKNIDVLFFYLQLHPEHRIYNNTHHNSECNNWSVFSSPELKAPVSFSDHFFFVSSDGLSVNFSHYQYLLQNYKATIFSRTTKLRDKSTCPSVCKLFTLPISSLELQSYQTNFNHIWNNAPFGKGGSKLQKLKTIKKN